MKRKTSILGTLTARTFRRSKSRNLVAILAILLTTMMFTTLFTLSQSMGQNMTEMYLRQAGTTAHTSTKSILDAEIEKIVSHPDVVSWGKSILVGTVENQALAGRQVEIRFASDSYAESCFASPTTGRLPQRADEIALDTQVLHRLGISPALGQTVTLSWRPDLSSSASISNTFTLCGFWEGNESVYASMAWVSEDFALSACGGAEGPAEGQILGTRNLCLTFADADGIEEKTAQILADCGLTGKVKFTTNLAYSAETQQMIFAENIPMYVGMVLVFLAGYLIIFNVFQISVASEIAFYGQLKTLGATKRQIRRIIFGQGNRLSLIGIPLGLVLGYLLWHQLVPILIATQDFTPTVSVHPLIFVGSALFAYLTVIISCLLPARLAGKVSPVEALRYTDAAPGSRKKEKKGRRGASLAAMAWANLWRNKKRTFLVLCSLTLGLVLMSFFYAKNASFDVEKYLLDLSVADFQLDDATNQSADGYDPNSQTIQQSLLDQLNRLGTVEATGRLYAQEVSLPVSQKAAENLSTYYTQDRLDEFASYDPMFPTWKASFDQAVAGATLTHTVYGADGLILEAAASGDYLLDGTYDPEAFATGNYVLAIGPAAEAQSGGLPTYAVGEEIQIEGRTFTVMAILSPLQPMVAGTTPAFDLPLVLQADVFTQLFPQNHLRKFYFNVADESLDAVSALLTDYQQTQAIGMNITSRQTMIDQYEAQTRSSSVMGYAISVVIALVGVLNFVNSMVTAIVSRKREFAMIQSVGMTKRQLRTMLTLEGLSYAGITLLLSYLLSAVVVGVLVRAMTADGFYTFQFTLFPLLLCTPILLVFAWLIPVLCFRNLEKQSIVERLRAID